MELLYVTNNSDKELVATFSFESYKFSANETVALSPEAAQHIFGYGEENNSELEQALEKLSKFEISTEPPTEKNRSLPSAVGVVPLRVEKRAGGKSFPRAA